MRVIPVIATVLFMAALVVGARWTVLAIPSVEIKPTPLILEKNEGEQRERRPREGAIASVPFTIKVDRKNGGSQHMWLGTEEIVPGGRIPRHQHLGQDEILLIETGTAHVWLGNQERDVHAGAVVFIPSETWISLKNIGNDPITLAFVFSAPGFDDYLRCTSAAAGERLPAMTIPEVKACQEKGHVHYASPSDTAPR